MSKLKNFFTLIILLNLNKNKNKLQSKKKDYNKLKSRKLDNKPPENIFFGGSAWGCAFYIGCYQALIEKYDNLDKLPIYGVSAGALIGLCVVLKLDIETMKSLYNDLVYLATKNGVFLKMTRYHNIVLKKILYYPDAYKKVNNRLHIGITIFPNKHLIVNKWKSNEELIHDLHCTFNIPFYTKYNSIKNKKLAIDGSISLNLNKYPKNTIFIGMGDNYNIDGGLSTKECTYPLEGKKFTTIIKKGYDLTNNYEHNSNNIITFKKKNFVFPIQIWWILKILSNLVLTYSDVD